MNERVQNTMAGVVVATAVVLAVVLVHREFFGSQGEPARRQSGPPEAIGEWKTLASHAIVTGNRAAKVQVTVFSDLECPVCRGFDKTLRDVRKQYAGEMSVAFVHFPLAQHRFALSAARAVECAEAAGRFDSLVALVYEKQDSLGLKSWGSFATEAGIGDTLSFAACVAQKHPIERVDSGRAVGLRIGVQGTPTVLVNQWRLQTPPSAQELLRIVAAVGNGRKPF